MAQPTLTKSQEQLWIRLFSEMEMAGVQFSNIEVLQGILRKFAVEIIKNQPDNDKIIVNGHVLIQFGPDKTFKSKQDYLDYHAKNGHWGDDAILSVLASAFGFNVVIHLLKHFKYISIEQPKATGIVLNIENHGAAQRGTHWTSPGKENASGGNCLYYAIAQEMQKCARDVKAVLPPAKVEKKSEATENLDKVIQEFAELEAKDQLRYDSAKSVLSKFSTKHLIDLYHHAVKHIVKDDTYLKRRPHFVTQEYGHDFLEAALRGQVNPEFKVLIREELIHMLAKEAWRNPEAYRALENFISSNHSKFFVGQKIKTSGDEPVVIPTIS